MIYGLDISLSVLSDPLIIQKNGKSMMTDPAARKMNAAALRQGLPILLS